MRSRKRLIFLVDGLTKEQKANYYRVCGVADSRLKRERLPPLNTLQCELICERLRSGADVTMADIKALAERQIAPTPRPEPPPPTPDLFDFSDDESS